MKHLLDLVVDRLNEHSLYPERTLISVKKTKKTKTDK